jgi:hypothetical protein
MEPPLFTAHPAFHLPITRFELLSPVHSGVVILKNCKFLLRLSPTMASKPIFGCRHALYSDAKASNRQPIAQRIFGEGGERRGKTRFSDEGGTTVA